MADNNETEKEPVFHYSRERRLSHASPSVRAIYEDGAPRKRGIFGFLFGSSGNALLFACIILIIFVLTLTSRLNRSGGITLGGNNLTVSIIEEEGINILSIIKKAPSRGEVYLGAVDMLLSPAIKDTEPLQDFQHRITFNSVDSESYMVSIPFEGGDFFVLFKAGDEEKAIRVKHNP